MLEVKEISFMHGGRKVLDRASFVLAPGEIMGLLGENGSGKTILLKTIIGLLRPCEGSVLLDGVDFNRKNRLGGGRYVRRGIGYLPDYFGSYGKLRVEEYMNYYAMAQGMVGIRARLRIQELLHVLGLEQKKNREADTLSRGEKQRLNLARALLADPKVLLLDEPSIGLDAENRYVVRNIFRRMAAEGKSFLITSHSTTEITSLCSTYGLIKNGKIIARGTMEDAMEIVHQHAPLRIRLTKEAPALVEYLRGKKEVHSISIDGTDLWVDFMGSQEEEAALLRQLTSRFLEVNAFARERGTLDALYYSMAQGGIE